MAAQWCSIQEMANQVPEIKNDIEIGIIPGVESERYIELATAKIKAILQNRYDITLYGSDPSLVPGTIRNMVAIQAGLFAIRTRQVGDAGTKREAYLESEAMFWGKQAANGSLLDDSDVIIPNDESTLVGDPLSGPTELEGIYSYGSRFAVRDSDLAVPFRGNQI